MEKSKVLAVGSTLKARSSEAIFMLEKPTGMEYSSNSMGLTTRETGLTTSRKEMVKNSRREDQSM